MGTIIIGLVVIFVGKFIYDTFLTDNTNKNWDEYKRKNPIDANVLETKSSFSIKSKQELRLDGYYVCFHNGTSPYGDPIQLTFYTIFSTKNKVFLTSFKGFQEIKNEDMKVAIKLMSEQSEPEEGTTKYFESDGIVTFRFGNYPDNYEEYSGSIIENGLVLSRTNFYFDTMLGEPKSKTNPKNMKFDFVQII